MRNILKPSLLGLVALALLAAGAEVARAQTQVRDARVLTARAGVVNLVSGAVEYNREGETAWRALTDADELKSGDVVKTGSGGRVEVLLNPGSYFRLGELSQLELADTSLDNLSLKLESGRAIVEATGYNGLDLSIVVNTPQTRVEILRTGIYRVNVLPSGVTEVAVWKGRARVGAKGEMVVKDGRVARVGTGGDVLVAKFDRGKRDDFDLWSRERGKELAKLNEMLGRTYRRETISSLDTFDFNNNLYGGVWVRSGSCYTFLPTSSSWRSPYGHGYNSWYYTPGNNCYQCPNRSGGVVNGGGNGRGRGSYGGDGGGGYGRGSGSGSGSGSYSGGGSSNSGGTTITPPAPDPPSRSSDGPRQVIDRPTGGSPQPRAPERSPQP